MSEDAVQVISRINPQTDTPFLGDCRLVVGDHVVEFRNGRARTNREAAQLLLRSRSADVEVFGLEDVAAAPSSAVAVSPDPATTLTLAEQVAALSDEDKAALALVLAPPAAPAPAQPPATEPIKGYDALNAKQVVEKLNANDPDLVAAVLAWETAHGNRKTILNACKALAPAATEDPELPDGATIGPDGSIEVADDAELTDEQRAQIEAAKAYLAEEEAAGNG